MGAIKDALQKINQTDADVKKELDNQLENMSALATAKAEYFKLLINKNLSTAGGNGSNEIPVKYVLDYTYQTHAYAHTSANSIASTISSSIEDFIQGGSANVMNGVAKLMTKTVQTLFGSTEGGEKTLEFMSVMSEGRALIRLDMLMWKRYTNVEKLSSSAEQISAFVLCKSTIDATALDYNTFLSLYQKNLFASGTNPDQIESELDKINKVYEKFLAYQKNTPKMLASINPESKSISDDLLLNNAILNVQNYEKKLGWD